MRRSHLLRCKRPALQAFLLRVKSGDRLWELEGLGNPLSRLLHTAPCLESLAVSSFHKFDYLKPLGLERDYLHQPRDLQQPVKSGSLQSQGKETPKVPSSLDSQRVPPGVCWPYRSKEILLILLLLPVDVILRVRG